MRERFFLKASPDFLFHLCYQGLGRHRLAIGSKPYGVALPVFDDEEIVKDPLHIRQGKGRGVAGFHPMECQAVVIADIADGPGCQGQGGLIGLVMLFQIGFEIRFGPGEIISPITASLSACNLHKTSYSNSKNSIRSFVLLMQ